MYMKSRKARIAPNHEIKMNPFALKRAAKKREPVLRERRAASRESGAFGDSTESPKALTRQNGARRVRAK